MSSNWPVCPYCHQALIRATQMDEEGTWTVRWVCCCEPDPRTVASVERQMQKHKNTIWREK